MTDLDDASWIELDLTAPNTVAAAVLEESKGVTPENLLVSVGDHISVQEPNFLKGHGTMLANEDEDDIQLVSTVCGAVKRLNKLITVETFKGRYGAQVGDVVVGRIAEVQTRRWVIEMSCTTQASLQLSAVQLPGGVQRRRTAEDELNMRAIFQEGDLIAAELPDALELLQVMLGCDLTDCLTEGVLQVQTLSKADGSVSLHMRGTKYGLLRYGQLVCVPCKLVRRRSSHFIDIENAGLQLVFGCNGWIFVRLLNKAEAKVEKKAMPFGASAAPEEFVDFQPDVLQWSLCARYATAIKCLAKINVPITVDLLDRVVEESDRSCVSCPMMLQMEFLKAVAELELARRGGGDDEDMDID